MDEWRDAQPGKILHELRTGEVARAGEIPHTPYYGTVDATPLWLMLLDEYHRWTADDELVERLWPNALALRSTGSTSTATSTATASSSTSARPARASRTRAGKTPATAIALP